MSGPNNGATSAGSNARSVNSAGRNGEKSAALNGPRVRARRRTNDARDVLTGLTGQALARNNAVTGGKTDEPNGRIGRIGRIGRTPAWNSVGTGVKIDAIVGPTDVRTGRVVRARAPNSVVNAGMTDGTGAKTVETTGEAIAGIAGMTDAMIVAKHAGIAANTVSSASAGTAISGVVSGTAVTAPTGGGAISGSAAIQG